MPARAPALVELPVGDARLVHDQLRGLVQSTDFPCVGARSAIKNGHYGFGLYEAMASEASTRALAQDLTHFVETRGAWESSFTTFMASFRSPAGCDEASFETALWDQLQMLHGVDNAKVGWDSRVSADPHNPHFSFSFAGEAFFVIGLHAASSRYARRFAWPTLCFNPHEQFEEIRRSGRFPRMRHVIRSRDAAVQGGINPMLGDFGETSEAAQYSGRYTDAQWRCPFNAVAVKDPGE